VDWERAARKGSSSGNQNGGLLYSTEVEKGSADGVYGHDTETSCAVCAPRLKNTAVYTRWGQRSCPSGTRTLYDGWVGKEHYTHKGSGANYLCMHPIPQKPDGASAGNHNGALIYGVEYENTGAVDKNNNQDAACVMCEKANTGSVYVQWGRKSCTNGHKTEYWGLIMADHYSHQKSEYICVDWERAVHATSSAGNENGGLLYSTELEQGSADKAYGHNNEVACAVCSASVPVYVRWGSRTCPSGAGKVYDSFIASEHYTHNGSGYNYLCMHPQPEKLPGNSAGNQNGALLYGVEYENTGAVDKNHNHDAACVVCEHKRPERVPYVQWGRKTCTNGHKTEYWGVIMADHYSHKKSEYICVDWERAARKGGSSGNQNGGLLYTTEMEKGSSDEIVYGHNRELSCAVCS